MKSFSFFRLMVRSVALAGVFGAVLCAPIPSRAQDPGDPAGNPTGTSGSYNGETNEGGSFDPYTGNAKRIVTDITVPGSNGAYPLAFTRIWNSRYGTAFHSDDQVLAPVTWRHSYQWSIQPPYPGASSYIVAYPDGRVSNFRGDRNNSPADPLLRGPTGTSDRLEVSATALPILHTSDGGAVVFGINCNGYAHALRIIDPYGATTILSYSPTTGLLTTVTEPGGRYLGFTYNAPIGAFTSLATVTANEGASNSVPQVVSYTHGNYGAGSGLHTVTYGEAGNSVAANSLPATYTYTNGSALPQLLTCDDSHAAGPMTHIGYTYNTASGVTGLVASVQYPIGNITVASLAQSPVAPTGTCTATVTRGDLTYTGQAISRQLVYGTTGSGSATYLDNSNVSRTQPFGAKAFQITSNGDYSGTGAASVTCYNGAYDATHAKGFPVMQIDRLQHATQFETEPITGRVTKTILPDQRTRTALWAYGCCASDSVGTYYLVQTVNERGQITTYHRNATTHLVESIDYPGGAHEYFTYQQFIGAQGYPYYKIKTATNRLGGVTQYQYTPVQPGHSDNVVAVSGSWTCAAAPTSGTQNTYFHYDAINRVDQISDDRNCYVRYIYDSQNRVAYTVNADVDNSYVHYQYDGYGNNISVTDELQHTTTFTYDDYRRVTSSTAPISSNVKAITNLFYDRRGTNYAVVSSAMSHTSSAPSLLEMPLNASTALGNATIRIFNPNGLAITETDGLQWDASHSNPYDVASSFYTTTTFDACDRPIQHTNHNRYASSIAYDNCGRPISTTDENGHTTTSSYYSSGTFCGWLHTVTAPGNNAATSIVTTISDYSNYGQPKAVIDNLSHHFNATFDLAGNTAQQDDGLHATTPLQYTRDTLGRIRMITHQDGTSEQWGYDQSGNVSTYTARNGETRTTSYDQRNRPHHSEWSMSGDSPVDTTYDDKSQLVTASNWASTVGFTYDNRGLVATESQNISGTSAGVQTVTYNRAADGKILSMQYPGGRAPLWVYNSLNQCGGLQGYTLLAWNGPWLTNRLLSNGVNTSSSDRQRDGRLNTQITSLNGTNFSVRSYGYYPNGQASYSSKSDDGLGESFFYEGTGQLQSFYAQCNNVPAPGTSPGTTTPGDQAVAYPTYCQQFRQYGYDAAGNPTGVFFNSSSFNYSFDAENRWSGLSYDASGDVTGGDIPGGLAGWSYYFPTGGMLRIGNGYGGASGSFLSDALGRKCASVLPGGAVQCFLYAGNQRIEERDSTNTVVKYTYYYDAPGSSSIAVRFDAPGNPYYYVYDARGNTTHLTNPSGQVVERYYYDARGLPFIQDASGNLRAGNLSAYDNRFLWNAQSGYEWLAGMGIYHAGARDYRPDLGRWLQPDPIGQAGGLNQYAYCGNDPVNQSDPSGLYQIVTKFETDASSNSSGGITQGYYNYGPNNEYSAYIDALGNSWDLTPGGGSSSSITLFGPDTSSHLTSYSPGDISQKASGTSSDGGGGGAMEAMRMLGNNMAGPRKLFVAAGYAGPAAGLIAIASTGVTVAGTAYYGSQAAFYGTVITNAMMGNTSYPAASGAAAEEAEAAEEGAFAARCFPSGTQVSTAQGDVNIEDIRVGDKIYACNLRTGEAEEETVTELLRNFTYHWVDVQLGAEVIRATRSHPFWVQSDKQWVEAANLKKGMMVRLENGNTTAVMDVSIVDLQQPQPSYNLEVSVNHDYFVGRSHILVHNGDGSYTLTFASGRQYVGKGDLSRAADSAARIARRTGDALVDTKWTPANGTADSFVQEEMRIRAAGGPGGNTYNQINSPGNNIAGASGCP